MHLRTSLTSWSLFQKPTKKRESATSMRSSHDVAPATAPPPPPPPPPPPTSPARSLPPESTASPTVSKEHDYATLESPRKLKRKLDIAVGRLTSYQSRVRAQHQKRRRLHRKVEKMSVIIDELKENQLVSPSCADLLEASCSGIPQLIMKRLLAGRKPSRGHAYHEELKAFALTLHFYSAKAYNFVRQSFQLALPHPRHIRTWYAKFNGDPGFTRCAFTALSAQVKTDAESNRRTVCSLMLDEMAIRRHVEYISGEYSGFVDIGNSQYDDSVPLAKDALVLMAVSMNASWKIPVAYFLIDGMSGSERANIIRECLHRLHSTGVIVASVTCDGPACHFSMLKDLGADISPSSSTFTPSFAHPADATTRVNVLLDACHMIKLVRNTFGDRRILYDGEGGRVDWRFIEELNTLQEEEGLRLGNRLRKGHIQWRKQKMKVNLAIQVISASVADALEYCDVELHLPQFSECAATVGFLRIFDAAFDLLNSRNPCGTGFKAPMRLTNREWWMNVIDSTVQYVMALKESSGKLMIEGKRKTGFLGFIICLRSVKEIFERLVACTYPPMRYLTTYKLSQDHLELFFSSVRARSGFNNNPTASQFKSSYKRLLMQHSIKTTGNCIMQDATHILSVMPDSESVTTVHIARKYDLLERQPLQAEHDYADMPNIAPTSQYKLAVINYIAGYVVRMVKKRIACLICQSALAAATGDTIHTIILQKDRGGLIKPSESVVRVCTEAEKCVSFMLKATCGALPRGKYVEHAIATAVLSNMSGVEVFTSLSSHMFDSGADDNHVHMLVKSISVCFTIIRLHHLGTRMNEEVVGEKVRRQLSKLILFKHQ